jgi:hypothetical protein
MQNLPALQPELGALTQELCAHLMRSTHPWARWLYWVLRTRAVFALPLPFQMQGLTNPLLPVILLDRKFVHQNRTSARGRLRIMHTLLHEAAHQLWAVWPEWRNWIGDRSHYGPERNAADAIAESVLRSCGLPGVYAGRATSYISPLQKLGLLRR